MLHNTDHTVCHPAIILNCFRVQNLSLGAVWASPTANGQLKQLYEKNCELRSNSKLWRDGILYHLYCGMYAQVPYNAYIAEMTK